VQKELRIMTDKEKIKQDYLNDLYNDYRYSIEKFDSQSLYIGSGPLAISLTFIKDIVPIEYIKLDCFYYLSIIFFVCNILLGFIAHSMSAKLINKRIEEVKKKNFNLPDDKTIPKINKWITGILVSGIISLSVFATYNFSQYQIIKKQIKMSEEKEKKENLNEISKPHTGKEKLEERAMPIKPIPPELKDPEPKNTDSSSKSGTAQSGTENFSEGKK